MDVRGKKVTVVGLGRTAAPVVQLLLARGARPFVTEQGDGSKQGELVAALDALGVPYELGGHTARAFADTALVIPSPGVPPGIEPIAEARRHGAAVVGEMEFAGGFCRSRVLAVTGTNGKTTTTELLRALVAACGHRVALAGNNAYPFSAAVQLEPAPEYIVLEVSSYQLETAQAFRPWVGAVLNVTPDHLARHRSLEEYAAVKARIFQRQGPDDVSAVNHDDPRVRAMAAGTRAAVWPFSQTVPLERGLWTDGTAFYAGREAVAEVSETPLRGRHNLENVLCALTMARAGGFDWERVREGLRAFRGVEHRIEHVASVGGVDFYNDSKSTNIDSLKVALESFTVPVVLIAGGRGKGSDYRVLRRLVGERVRALVTLGEDAARLRDAFGDLVAVSAVSSMAEAVEQAAALARPGDVALLSPACASFDMYESFEHRGRVFKECVRGYAKQRGA